MNELDNTLPDINAGRLTFMRWSYAFVMSLLCCINETVAVFIAIAHACIFAFRFLNKETSHFIEVKRQENKKEKIRNSQIAYQESLPKTPWVAQFIVKKPIQVAEVVETVEPEKPVWTSKKQEIWESGFNDESNTIEFDITVNPQTKVVKEAKYIELEL